MINVKTKIDGLKEVLVFNTCAVFCYKNKNVMYHMASMYELRKFRSKEVAIMTLGAPKRIETEFNPVKFKVK